MMSGMNPFDQPPTEPPASLAPPVSLDPPNGSGRGGSDGPRRGRMALAALAAAGLVGGGIVVAGQFASADEPSLDATASVDEPGDDVPTPERGAEPDDESDDGTGEGWPSIDGEIVIDDGDGDPFVLDLGALGECVGPILRGGSLFDLDGEWDGEGRTPMPFDDEFHQRMEEFLEELPWDDLGDLELGDGFPGELHDDGVRIFGSGGSMITVVGPDGVEVIDLGEGDATVTIEQRDGELTVETDGDATVSDLPGVGELLPGLGEWDPQELEDLDLSELLPFDLDEIESCLDDLD
jgi:hypothetical protein